MSLFVSICTDMAALRESGAVDEDSPYRGLIDGRSGAYVQYSTDGTQSMVILTSLEGLEPLAEFPYITVTSYEEIFGHWRASVDEDGVEYISVSYVTEQQAYQVQIDGPEYTVMTLDHQITPGWEVESVQNRNEDPDDDIPDGQFEDGFHDEWTFTGTPETDDDGNEVLWDTRGLTPTKLVRQGWMKNTINVGDHIKLYGHIGHTNKTIMSIIDVTLPDGQVLTSRSVAYDIKN